MHFHKEKRRDSNPGFVLAFEQHSLLDVLLCITITFVFCITKLLFHFTENKLIKS